MGGAYEDKWEEAMKEKWKEPMKRNGRSLYSYFTKPSVFMSTFTHFSLYSLTWPLTCYFMHADTQPLLNSYYLISSPLSNLRW